MRPRCNNNIASILFKRTHLFFYTHQIRGGRVAIKLVRSKNKIYNFWNGCLNFCFKFLFPLKLPLPRKCRFRHPPSSPILKAATGNTHEYWGTGKELVIKVYTCTRTYWYEKYILPQSDFLQGIYIMKKHKYRNDIPAVAIYFKESLTTHTSNNCHWSAVVYPVSVNTCGLPAIWCVIKWNGAHWQVLLYNRLPYFMILITLVRYLHLWRLQREAVFFFYLIKRHLLDL